MLTAPTIPMQSPSTYCARAARGQRCSVVVLAWGLAVLSAGCADGAAFAVVEHERPSASVTDDSGEPTQAAEELSALTRFELPPGFPPPRIPATNPLTDAKIELGRHLFYDTRLSGNGEQSCASCHEQAKAFADGQALPTGSTGEVHHTNSLHLVNAVYQGTLTWANPLLTSLETQIFVPIFGEEPVELGAAPFRIEIIDRLAADAYYQAAFPAAFPERETPLDWDAVAMALASFVRSLISGNSAFDRFVYQGEAQALSASAKRGMDLFFSEEFECHHCHGGFNFTEASVHANTPFEAMRFNNTGLYNIDGEGGYPLTARGLIEFTGAPSDMGRFRAPSLRNVAVTAPYMHDGSVETLGEVIDIYAAGGRVITDGPHAGDGRLNPFKSGFVVGFALNERQRGDLLAFLESLTDEAFLSNPRFANPWSAGEDGATAAETLTRAPQ